MAFLIAGCRVGEFESAATKIKSNLNWDQETGKEEERGFGSKEIKTKVNIHLGAHSISVGVVAVHLHG